MVHVLQNNRFVWEKVPELDFTCTIIFKKVIFNEIWRKLVTNDGGVYLLLTNEIYPECLLSLQNRY